MAKGGRGFQTSAKARVRAVAGFGQRFEDSLDLIFAASFEGHVNESVPKSDAVISAIELQLDDIRVMGRDNLGQLMQGTRAVRQMNLQADEARVLNKTALDDPRQ